MSTKSGIPSNSSFGMDWSRSPAFQRAVLRAAQFKCLEALRAGKIRLVQDPSVGMPNKFTPRMDLIEDRSSRKLTAVFELPGVKTSDITLQIREGNLIIAGERRPPPVVQKALGSQKALPRNPIAAADELVSGEMRSDSSISITELPVHELRFGTFYRALPVPTGIKESDVTASLQDGMLTVTWPTTPQRTSMPLMSSKLANATQ